MEDDGPANQVYLENPRGNTLDSDGNIVNSEKHKIRKIKK